MSQSMFSRCKGTRVCHGYVWCHFLYMMTMWSHRILVGFKKKLPFNLTFCSAHICTICVVRHLICSLSLDLLPCTFWIDWGSGGAFCEHRILVVPAPHPSSLKSFGDIFVSSNMGQLLFPTNFLMNSSIVRFCFHVLLVRLIGAFSVAPLEIFRMV